MHLTVVALTPDGANELRSLIGAAPATVTPSPIPGYPCRVILAWTVTECEWSADGVTVTLPDGSVTPALPIGSVTA